MWLKLNRLCFSVTKTKAMIFHTRNHPIIFRPNIMIEGNSVEYVDKFNYLLIFLDNYLTFDKHISMIRQKIWYHQ